MHRLNLKLAAFQLNLLKLIPMISLCQIVDFFHKFQKPLFNKLGE